MARLHYSLNIGKGFQQRLVKVLDVNRFRTATFRPPFTTGDQFILAPQKDSAFVPMKTGSEGVVAGAMAGTISGVASLSLSLQGRGRMTNAITGVALISANMSGRARIISSITGVASVSANGRLKKRMTASINGVASASIFSLDWRDMRLRGVASFGFADFSADRGSTFEEEANGDLGWPIYGSDHLVVYDTHGSGHAIGSPFIGNTYAIRDANGKVNHNRFRIGYTFSKRIMGVGTVNLRIGDQSNLIVYATSAQVVVYHNSGYCYANRTGGYSDGDVLEFVYDNRSFTLYKNGVVDTAWGAIQNGGSGNNGSYASPDDIRWDLDRVNFDFACNTGANSKNVRIDDFVFRSLDEFPTLNSGALRNAMLPLGRTTIKFTASAVRLGEQGKGYLVSAKDHTETFEDYTLGDLNSQGNWLALVQPGDEAELSLPVLGTEGPQGNVIGIEGEENPPYLESGINIGGTEFSVRIVSLQMIDNGNLSFLIDCNLWGRDLFRLYIGWNGFTPEVCLSYDNGYETLYRDRPYEEGDVIGFSLINGVVRLYVNGEIDTAWGEWHDGIDGEINLGNHGIYWGFFYPPVPYGDYLQIGGYQQPGNYITLDDLKWGKKSIEFSPEANLLAYRMGWIRSQFPFSDDFESYTEGDLDGQGGWYDSDALCLIVQDDNENKLLVPVVDSYSYGFHNTGSESLSVRLAKLAVIEGYCYYHPQSGSMSIYSYVYPGNLQDPYFSLSLSYDNDPGSANGYNFHRNSGYAEGDVIGFEHKGGIVLLYVNGVIDTEWQSVNEAYLVGDEGVYQIQPGYHCSRQDSGTMQLQLFNSHGTNEIAFDDVDCSVPETIKFIASGELTQETPSMTASISGVASVSAILHGHGRIAGSITGVALISASIHGYGRMTSSVTGVASVTASLHGHGSMSFSLLGAANLTVSLRGRGRITVGVVGVATVSAIIHGHARISAIITGVSSVSGSIHGHARISGLITGVALVSADLSFIPPQGGIRGGVNIQLSASGGMKRMGRIVTNILSAGVVSASARGRGRISGIILAVAMVQSHLEGKGRLRGSELVLFENSGAIRNAIVTKYAAGETTVTFMAEATLHNRYLAGTTITFLVAATITMRGRLRGIDGAFVQSVCKEVINDIN